MIRGNAIRKPIWKENSYLSQLQRAVRESLRESVFQITGFAFVWLMAFGFFRFCKEMSHRGFSSILLSLVGDNLMKVMRADRSFIGSCKRGEE